MEFKGKVALLSFLFLRLAFGQEQCGDEFDNFISCIKKEVGMLMDNLEVSETQWEKEVDELFKKENCPPPEWNLGLHAEVRPSWARLIPSIQKSWERVPSAVKLCIGQKMRAKILEEIQLCLKSKNIPFSIPAETEINIFEPMAPPSDPGMYKLFEMRVNFERAIRICRGSAEDEMEDRIRTGIYKIRDAVFNFTRDACAAEAKCSRSMSKVCIDRGAELRVGLCTCAREKAFKVREKIEDLRDQGWTTPDDLVSVFSDGLTQVEIVNSIHGCFQETGHEPPEMLRHLRGMLKGRQTGFFRQFFKIRGSMFLKIIDILNSFVIDEPAVCNHCEEI